MSIFKIGLIGKSPPGKIKDIMNYLTRSKVKNTDLPEVTTADKIPIPPKKQTVEEMEAVNEFVRRNPRVEKADGGRIPFAGGKKVIIGPNKGKYFYYIGKGDNRRTYYADSPTDGEAWVKANRMREGYDKPPGKKITMTEKNKAAQKMFGKNYNELPPRGLESQKTVYDKIYGTFKTKTDKPGKFKVKTQASELSATDQAKIKKVYPEAKFTKRNKYGFPPDHPLYNDVWRFVNERNFKTPYEGGMFKSLPKYAQNELINAFPDIKFNFERGKAKVIKKGGRSVISTKGVSFSRYGIPITHPRYNAVARYFDDPKPFRFGFNLKTAGGWTLAQMDRAATQGDTRYEPILQKPNKPISKTNKIIGMIDKTGKKPITYNIDNILKIHPNRNEIIKYYDVAQLSRTPLSKYENIVKLLPKGFDPEKIQLNDLLQFIAKDKGGINRAMRAIEIHHTRGITNEATGSFQLLRKDLNKLADTIERQIADGKLGKSAELLKKGIRVETGGVKYGPKKVSPQQDFKKIISDVEQELGKFTKTDFNKFKSALQKIGCPGLAGGGRAGFQDGTTCFNKGVEKLKGDPTKLSPGDQANLRTLGKSVKAVSFLKNVLGPGAIVGELVFEGGVAANKFLNEGMPIKQALGESYINKYLLGEKLKIDLEEERKKELLEREMPDGTKIMLEDTPFNIARGEEFAAAKRGERMFLPQGEFAIDRRLKERENEMKALYPQLKDANLSNEQIDEVLKEQNVFSPFTLGFGMQQMQPGIGDTKYNEDVAYQEIRDLINQAVDKDIQSQQFQNIATAGGVANLAGGGIAKLAGVDSGPPPESGPNSQGLQGLMKRVRNR